MRKWVPMYAAILLMLVGTHVSAAGRTSLAADPARQSRLEAQVQQWTEALSEQPQFKIWKNAAREIVPIGPGQHGWLVTFLQERKPVGYMIVHAAEDGGFKLGEYGIGIHPAFDPNTLYNSLIRQGFFKSYADALKTPLKLEREYIHPLLAVWKWQADDGMTYYFDAFTAEALPIDTASWTAQAGDPSYALSSTSQAALTKVDAFRLNETFDPYERLPWLTKSPLTGEQVFKLTRLLDNKEQIRFTAELYDKTVLFVWPAIGYHVWNGGTVYVAFDQYGTTRYVPLDSLQAGGRFYR